VTSCVVDLFEGLEKTDLLPSLYANPALCMVRDISLLSDAELAEVALAKELRKLMGEKEYARQRELGIGIGGASYEQKAEWGADEYARQRKLGIGIFDPKHAAAVHSGRVKGAVNGAKKEGSLIDRKVKAGAVSLQGIIDFVTKVSRRIIMLLYYLTL
jgi:hypothetical protein